MNMDELRKQVEEKAARGEAPTNEKMEALTGVKLTGDPLEDSRRMAENGWRPACYNFPMRDNKNEHLDEMIRALEETGKGFSVEFMTLRDGTKLAMLKVDDE